LGGVLYYELNKLIDLLLVLVEFFHG